ncbi:vascular endothelial growth factor receptor 1-like [Daphnia carinata]|uniref:vascular endothelial growth factor receptor 1-like n=1 Tax=Daphnia carinata TaxID=120202 RepID=UPI00257F8DBF|nr:vascular endothelial growth factor receptor 1-like [Daphnia carinata]
MFPQFHSVHFIILLGICRPLLGVYVRPLARQIPLGNPLEIICRAEHKVGLPVLIQWRWIANGAIIDLQHARLPPGAVEIFTSVEDSATRSMSYVVSRIRWKSVPAEATGIYQCRDANNARHPTSNTTLSVSTVNDVADGFHGMRRSPAAESAIQHIFRAGSAFNLSCEGDEFGQVEWLGPHRVDEDSYYVREMVIPPKYRWSKSVEFNDYSSTSILTVKDASYLDTGYYTCHNKDDYNDIRYRQFVYVEDPEKLILPPALQPVGPNKDLRVIGHYSETNVKVGCGPTHPSVNVILKKFDDDIKVIASSSDPNDPNSDWTYDPFEGFRIKVVDSWEMKGQHQCEATWPHSNKKSTSAKFKIKIQGVQVLKNTDASTPIVEGDRVTLTCRSKNKDAMDLAWRWLPATLKPNQTIHSLMEINATHLPAEGIGYLTPFENETSDQEYPPPLGTFQVHRLSWLNIPMEASGIYQCYDANNLNIPVSNTTVDVLSSKAPNLKSPEDEQKDVQRGYETSLECGDTAAFPKPKVQWFMRIENKPLEEISDDGRTKYHDINTTEDGRNSVLVIYYASADATYICRFSNWKGSREKYFHVTVHGLHGGIIAAIAIVVAIIIAAIIAVVFFIKTSYKQKQLYQELINNRLKLLEGNLERINPNSPLEEQLDLLPYDNKYEFPANHLVLGKQLGAGQFGRVVQAKAVGMGPGNTNVAVKMVKSQLDNTGLTSLASELKILIHLGFHMNVVSLLGACTKNLIKGELMVIVEFCAYGNLQDFLMTNRRHFVSELHEHEPSPHCQRKAGSQFIPQLVQNIHNMDLGLPGENIPNGTSADPASSDNNADSKARYWLPNSTKKETSRSPVVCTHDLIEWSYQIACGMNYLTKRKVLHGDLAARNVLLADDNVVKIADFGLSRQVYKNCNYQKQGQEALPVKWMAIESLIDRVFSSQSDVWSFGVTIWELFSLSKQPYPEVNELADLIRYLQRGDRMETPEQAPEAIGNIMADCWKHNPEERATFSQLERIIGQMVDPIIRQRFAGTDDVEETNNYLQMNTEIDPTSTSDTMPDYLKMTSTEGQATTAVSPPRSHPPKLYPQLSLTNYVNTSTEINTPPHTAFVKKDSNTVGGGHPPLSPTESLADSNYLAMLPTAPM